MGKVSPREKTMGNKEQKANILQMRVWFVGSPAGLMAFLQKLADQPIVSPYCRIDVV